MGRARSHKELRRQVEAAEARGPVAPEPGTEAPVVKKKRATKEGAVKKKPAVRAKRSKIKAPVRKRLIWGVFSSSLKEEGRFPYADREAADNRAAELTAKHRKTFFVQPIKEPLAGGPVEKVFVSTSTPKSAPKVREDDEPDEDDDDDDDDD